MADNLKIVADMVLRAERHAEDLSADRVRAIEYYQGVMNDTPADVGRSQMVTRDVRAHIKKVLPSIMRTLLNGDEVVEYLPVEQGDEEGAQQASDYVNYVALQECGARSAIHDAIHDALLLRNGILKAWQEEKQCVKISSHTGLTDDAFGQLAGDDETEVLEHSVVIDVIEGQKVPLHDVKIRRAYTEKKLRVAAVPRERFLIHPDAVSLTDSILTGEKDALTRSDLVTMGYDRDTVYSLPLAADDDDIEFEENVRRETDYENDEAAKSNQPIDYYDLFIRVDMDGDGISELRHMCFAGGLTEKNLLLDEEVDEVQYYDLTAMRQPHQWEGISLADDIMDIQRAKTVLFRQTLDNLYWQNNPQPIVQNGAIADMKTVLNPEFGLPIRVNEGFSVRDAFDVTQVPFVASESFGMMEYLDNEAMDRTGVSDASAGLAPDALQNMTAKASAMIEQSGIGQTEFMVRSLAEGLNRFFKGLLRLVIRHADVPRTVRLRDEWVEVDPRHWNAGMDCAVNTGLGAGTRERDMAVMQMVMNAQEKLLAGFGPDNPFVKPENVWAALSRFVESAGLKTPSMYFTEPDPQEVQAKLEQMRNQPNPEQMKIQAQMQLEQAKMQTNAAKEKAQMEADLTVKQAEIAARRDSESNKLAADAALNEQRMSWEREKFAAEMALEREKMAAERERDAAARQDSIWQHQAKGIAA